MGTFRLLLRAAVALVLVAAFAAMALAAVGGLGYLAVHFVQLGFVHHRAAGALWALLAGLLCAVGAVLVAWSVAPRFGRVDPSGVAIDPAGQPALYEEILGVATALGVTPPSELFLTLDANAWAADRGAPGFSRRVMGIGLLALHALNVGELRAVLAHELAHFGGGDTRLWRWVHQLRGAVVRTVVNLGHASAQASSVDMGFMDYATLFFGVLRAPFLAFARLELRLTAAISRAQELRADEIAARHAGTAPCTSALEKLERAAALVPLYLARDVAPLVEEGFLPPLGEGLELLLRASRAAMEQAPVRQNHPWDSHPPLHERLARARAAGSERLPDTRPAAELLEGGRRLEARLVALESPDVELEPVWWSDSGRILAARWRELRRLAGSKLGTFTVVSLPRDSASLRALVQRSLGDEARTLPPTLLHSWAATYFGGPVCDTLTARGFEATVRPGAPVCLRREDLSVEPFVELERYFADQSSDAAWRELWTKLGVANDLLAPADAHSAAGTVSTV